MAARVIRDTGADLISPKIGINLVNADLMRVRAFGPAVHGFLDTIRDGHPETPLLVVSPTACPIHESTPGPSDFDAASLAEALALRGYAGPTNPSDHAPRAPTGQSATSGAAATGSRAASSPG